MSKIIKVIVNVHVHKDYSDAGWHKVVVYAFPGDHLGSAMGDGVTTFAEQQRETLNLNEARLNGMACMTSQVRDWFDATQGYCYGC